MKSWAIELHSQKENIGMKIIKLYRQIYYLK